MKILSVEINNITSIEGPFLIDFESKIFSNIGLFGITGPVGAGKSTIIDSICLALYNTTPRLDRTTANTNIKYEKDTLSINNSQNLLRRGASSGSAEVRFKAIDGHIWRSTWLLRRANNKAAGKLQNVSILLFNETLNEPFPDNKITKVLEQIKVLIGLDFKQFTKSVILAQGDFQAFLNASDNDRAQILEKLTGTEIYSEISKAIYEKNNQIKDEFQQIDNQINALNLLTEEEITALTKTINELKVEIESIKINADQLKTSENWYQIKEDLNSQINKINSDLEQARLKVITLKTESDLLKNIEKVQEIKPLVIENKQFNLDQNSLEKKITHLKNEFGSLQNEINTLHTHIVTETETKIAIEQQIILNEPLYLVARELDIKLQQANKNIEEQTLKSKARALEIENTTNAFDATSKITESKNKQIDQINLWFSTNKLVENWAENSSLLQHQFQQLELVNNDIELLLTDHKNIKLDAQKSAENHNNTKIKKAEFEKLVNQIVSEIETQKSLLGNQNIEQNIAKQSTLNNELSVLKDLKVIATDYTKILKQNENTKSEKNLSEKNLENEIIQLKKVEDSIILLSEKLKQQAFYVAKLKLENSKDVLHLRSQLEEGHECPVCGSTDHKLAKVTVLNDLLFQAEVDLKNLEKQEKELFSAETKHKTQADNLKGNLDSLQVKNIELDLELKLLSENWQSNCVTAYNLNLENKNVLADIEQLFELKKNELAEITSFIDRIIAVQNTIEQKEKDKTKIAFELEQINQTLNELNVAEEKFKNKLEQIKIDGAKLRNQQIESLAELSKIINQVDWQIQFEQNANGFKQIVFNQIELWNKNVKKIADLKTEISQYDNELAKLKASLEEKTKEYNDLSTSLNKVIQEFDQQKTLRNNYFNGQQVDVIEQELKNKLNQQSLLLQKLQEKWQVLHSNQIKIKTSCEENEKQVHNYQQKIEQNNHLVLDFISKYKLETNVVLDMEELQKLCEYSHEWVMNTREKIEQNKQQLLKLEGQKITLTNQFEKHETTNTPKQSLEDIKLEKIKIETISEELQKKLITEKGKEINHNNNINSQKELLTKREELLPDYNEWAELSGLLGSASGDKLKKLAQQYTLDLLLQAANAQLQQINNRYILERIDETLSILVIDQYMANNKRATNSLSGGETFLISLALSLALSTISSTQLQVESLFIDEGFGSLDPNSLETAFLALENLQNQGRMIGIISHLDSVIDRLTVKIEVLPQGNGKSKVQIIA